MSNETSTTRYQTLGVLGGIYKSEKQAMLTHTYDTQEQRVICTRVKTENLADEYSQTAEELAELPTCAMCAKRDPRFQGAR